jgi:hypothetical protein
MADNRDRTSQAENAPAGSGAQNDLSHSDSGNSGGSKQTTGGPGTAGSVELSGPGAPQPPK